MDNWKEKGKNLANQANLILRRESNEKRIIIGYYQKRIKYFDYYYFLTN